MTTTSIQARLRTRRSLGAQWISANPVLGLGEIAWETDSDQGKIGDGASAYNSLPYTIGTIAMPRWQALTAVTTGQPLSAPDGSVIASNSTRTTRSSFDATEAAFWTPVETTIGTLSQSAIEAKYGMWVSVKDKRFAGGAKGDNATDDSAAIAAAVAYVAGLGGGTIFFPAGTYLTTTIYSRASNLRFMGAGGGATTLKRLPTTAFPGGTGDSRIIAINSVSTGIHPQTDYDSAPVGTYVSNITIQDMTCDGNGANTANFYTSGTVQGTVYCGQVKNLTVRGVYVVNPRSIGIHAASCINGVLTNCTVDGMYGQNSFNQFQVAGDAYDANPGFTFNQRPSTNVRVTDCKAINAAQTGCFGFCIQASNAITVTGCHADFTGNPTGRTCYGIIAEQGGNVSNSLGRQYVFSNNYVTYALNGIGAMDTSGSTTSHTATMNGLVCNGNVVDQTINAYRGDGSNLAFSGNTAMNCRTGFAIGKGATGTAAPADYNVTVVGNNVYLGDMTDTTGGSGLVANANVGSLSGLMVSNNIFTQTNSGASTGVGIYFLGGITDFVVSGNSVRDFFYSGIYIQIGTSTPRRGRIVNNILNNVVRTVGAPFPQNRSITNQGGLDIWCMFNHIVPGAGSLRHTSNISSGTMTILGNTIDTGATAYNDETSVMFFGTVTGSRGSNAALLSLLTQLKGMQGLTDSTVP